MTRDQLIEACKTAYAKSHAGGRYGWGGFFTAREVKMNLAGVHVPQDIITHLEALVAEGVLVRGTPSEAYACSTSAHIYKLAGIPLVIPRDILIATCRQVADRNMDSWNEGRFPASHITDVIPEYDCFMTSELDALVADGILTRDDTRSPLYKFVVTA